MSVNVIIRFPVSDKGRVREAFKKNADLLTDISKDAQGQGAIHHNFFQADGEVVAVDEWENREAFDNFFMSNDKIRTVTTDAGVNGAPKVEYLDQFDAPGDF